MDDVRELVSYLSKAERGYTKTLNREFLKAGFDLSIQCDETIEYPDETWVCAAENVSGR